MSLTSLHYINTISALCFFFFFNISNFESIKISNERRNPKTKELTLVRDSERAEWEVANESLLPPMEWGFGVCMFGCEGEWECVHSKRAGWEVADESLLPPMGFLPSMVWWFGVCMFRCEGEWECVLVSESEKWKWQINLNLVCF